MQMNVDVCIWRHAYQLTYWVTYAFEHRPVGHFSPSISVLCYHLLSSSSHAVNPLFTFLPRDFFHVFLVCRLPLWFCGVHCSACLAVLGRYFLLTCVEAKSIFFVSTDPAWSWSLFSVAVYWQFGGTLVYCFMLMIFVEFIPEYVWYIKIYSHHCLLFSLLTRMLAAYL